METSDTRKGEALHVFSCFTPQPCQYFRASVEEKVNDELGRIWKSIRAQFVELSRLLSLETDLQKNENPQLEKIMFQPRFESGTLRIQNQRYRYISLFRSLAHIEQLGVKRHVNFHFCYILFEMSNVYGVQCRV